MVSIYRPHVELYLECSFVKQLLSQPECSADQENARSSCIAVGKVKQQADLTQDMYNYRSKRRHQPRLAFYRKTAFRRIERSIQLFRLACSICCHDAGCRYRTSRSRVIASPSLGSTHFLSDRLLKHEGLSSESSTSRTSFTNSSLELYIESINFTSETI